MGFNCLKAWLDGLIRNCMIVFFFLIIYGSQVQSCIFKKKMQKIVDTCIEHVDHSVVFGQYMQLTLVVKKLIMSRHSIGLGLLFLFVLCMQWLDLRCIVEILFFISFLFLFHLKIHVQPSTIFTSTIKVILILILPLVFLFLFILFLFISLLLFVFNCTLFYFFFLLDLIFIFLI